MFFNNKTKILAVALILSCVFLVGCKDDSNDDYLSQFKEGSLLHINEPVKENGRRNFHPWNKLPSGYEISQAGFYKQRARVLEVFKNDPTDFKYADAVPYSIVITWTGYETGEGYLSNNDLRNIEITKMGRSYKPSLAVLENKEDLPCYQDTKLVPRVINDKTAIINVIAPLEKYQSAFDKVKNLRKGDFIEFYGRNQDLKKEEDTYEQALKTISNLHGDEAFGPKNPMLMQIFGLKVINHEYLNKSGEKSCYL